MPPIAAPPAAAAAAAFASSGRSTPALVFVPPAAASGRSTPAGASAPVVVGAPIALAAPVATPVIQRPHTNAGIAGMLPPMPPPAADDVLDDGLDDAMDENAGELDWAATQFSFFDKVKHFLRGERIKKSNRPMVEIAAVLEAGAFVTSLDTMHNNEKFEKMNERYLQLIDEFEDSAFDSPSIRDSVKTKMYRAQNNLSGERRWAKYGEFKSKCRTMSSKLPTNLASIPSGNQLHDAYKTYLRDRYRFINVSTILD